MTTKAKSKTKSENGPVHHQPWSAAEIRQMNANINSAVKVVDGIRKTSEETGRSVGTITQKYYALRRAKVTQKMAAQNKAKAAAKAKAKTPRMPVSAPEPAVMDLSGLSIDSLVEIQQGIHDEIMKRKADTASMLERLNSLQP